MPFILPFIVMVLVDKAIYEQLTMDNGPLWLLFGFMAVLTVVVGIVMVFDFIDASVERSFHRGRRV